MRFLKDKRGDSATEWLVVAAIAIAVVGVMIWAVVSAASAQGGNVQTWIDGIAVPAAP
jgi:Flp pilus assembly pilin Flp